MTIDKEWKEEEEEEEEEKEKYEQRRLKEMYSRKVITKEHHDLIGTIKTIPDLQPSKMEEKMKNIENLRQMYFEATEK